MWSGVLKLQWPSNSSYSAMLPEHAWEQLHREIMPLRIAVVCATSCHGGICQTGDRRMSTEHAWEQLHREIMPLRIAVACATSCHGGICQTGDRRMSTEHAWEQLHREIMPLRIAVACATSCHSGICQSGERRMSGHFVHLGISGLNHAITSNRVCHKAFQGVVRHFIATSCKCSWQWLA